MSITIDEYLLLPPDWESSLTHKRIWKTSIQKTILEGEKRSALFTWPRRSFRYNIKTMSISETNYFIRKVFKSLHKVWGIPFWIEGQPLTSHALNSQAVLEIPSTEKSNFSVGGMIVILTDENNYEAGEVLSMTSTSITLTQNLASSHAEGTYVYPILKGRMTVTQDMDKLTDANVDYQLDILEVPDPAITHVPFTTSSFPEYQTFPIFNTAPNWVGSLGLSFEHNYDLMQFIGLSFSESEVMETNLKFRAEYLFGTSSELYEILAFFDDRKGRWDKFWVSTDAPDIELTSAQNWDDTILSIKDIEWNDYWSSSETENMGQYIEFHFPDGYKVQRKILSSGATTITLDAATGVEITTAMLPYIKVSFLLLSHFSTDEVEVNMITDMSGDITFTFTSIYESIDYVASTPPGEPYTG